MESEFPVLSLFGTPLVFCLKEGALIERAAAALVIPFFAMASPIFELV